VAKLQGGKVKWDSELFEKSGISFLNKGSLTICRQFIISEAGVNELNKKSEILTCQN
jgi:hypothetical protein